MLRDPVGGTCHDIVLTKSEPQAGQWATNNAAKAACVAVGGFMVAAPMVAAAPILGAIGLSGAGPIAGS